MYLSRHIIVPALTIFQWSVASAYVILTPRAPATIAHSRDFHVVKRQIRNADYAGAAPPNKETTSASTTYSYPPTTSTSSTDYAPTSRPAHTAKGSSKDSRSINIQPRYHHDSTALLPARSSDNSAPATTEKRNAEDSPIIADDVRPRSPRQALADVSQRLPTRAYPGVGKTQIDPNHTRRSPRNLNVNWWKRREELISEAVPKFHGSRDDSDIIARALQRLPTKRFMGESSLADLPFVDSKHRRRLLDPKAREVKIHDLPTHSANFSGEKRKDPDSVPVSRSKQSDGRAISA